MNYGFKMIVDEINAHPNILPNHRLVFKTIDTACDPAVSEPVALDLLSLTMPHDHKLPQALGQHVGVELHHRAPPARLGGAEQPMRPRGAWPLVVKESALQLCTSEINLTRTKIRLSKCVLLA